MASVPEIDWFDWHRRYENPMSRASRRLRAVQRVLRTSIDQVTPGPFTAISLCAGQGHDILGVLADHPRRADASVTFVELDPRNVERALATARALEIPNARGIVGDAGTSDLFTGLLPASLVILAGFVVHISEGDFGRLIGALPQFCMPGSIVVWNRGRRGLTRRFERRARQRFTEAGFEPAQLGVEPDREFGVHAERFTGITQPLQTGVRLFTFSASPRRPSHWIRLKRMTVRSISSARSLRSRRARPL